MPHVALGKGSDGNVCASARHRGWPEANVDRIAVNKNKLHISISFGTSGALPRHPRSVSGTRLHATEAQTEKVYKGRRTCFIIHALESQPSYPALYLLHPSVLISTRLQSASTPTPAVILPLNLHDHVHLSSCKVVRYPVSNISEIKTLACDDVYDA